MVDLHSPALGAILEPVTTALSFDHLIPEGLALKPFQTNGVGYAAVARRTFIADEMGLGKTWQALVTLEATDSFPAVVACPATLKGNWEAEAKRLLPHRTVAVASGRTPYAVDADIVIVNYDIISTWAEALAQPIGLVCDESHYVKTPGAARTKAVRALADSVPAEGVVLLLTGTPIQNRPVELVAQLQILGTLDKVAPNPQRASGKNGEFTDKDWEFAFKFAYCGAQHNGHGWDFKGASNLTTLNDRLRSTCFIRRERQTVLGLNDTRRTVLPLALNGALKAYKAAEANIVAFCAAAAQAEAEIKALKEGGDPESAGRIAALQAEARVKRAEALTALTVLRQQAGLAKVDATVEWVKNFFDSNPEKSLVVFAWHKEVQSALIEALAEFKPAMILGGQKDVEAQKARFQTGDTRLIVCSIKAASEGHTLTAASDVLFAEQPWHSGAEQQAEDRCNRIGQEAEQVFAWKVLAQGTVDEHVHALIEAKRAVVRAAVVGDGAEDDGEAGIEANLLKHFMEEGAKQVKAPKAPAARRSTGGGGRSTQVAQTRRNIKATNNVLKAFGVKPSRKIKW
jgi:hypothetical protein